MAQTSMLSGWQSLSNWVISFSVRGLRAMKIHAYHLIFSRNEDKYMPQDKGQVEEIAVRAVWTKIMWWTTSVLYFRFYLHETSCERSSWWHFEYVLRKNPYQVWEKNARRVLLKTEVKEKDTRNKNPSRLFFVMVVQVNFKVWAYITSSGVCVGLERCGGGSEMPGCLYPVERNCLWYLRTPVM